MDEKTKFNIQIISKCCVLFLIALIFTLLVKLQVVIIPFTISLLFYFLSLPVMYALRTRNVFYNMLISILVFTAVVLGIILVIMLLSSSLRELTSYFDQHQKELAETGQFLLAKLKKLGFNFQSNNLLEDTKFTDFFNYIKTITQTFLSFTNSMVLFLVFFFFMVFGFNYKKNRLNKINVLIMKQISTYAWIKIVTSTATGLFVGLIHYLFSSEFTVPIAVLTVLLNFIPNIGSVIATIIPLPLLYMQFGFSVPLIMIVFLSATIQMIIGNIVEPKYIGNILQFHPVVVIFALVFWGILWGIPGMFLAIPLTVVAKIIFARFPTTSFISKFLSESNTKGLFY